MITHSEIQGTPEWLSLRRDYFTASEAPAMMGCSPYMTRTELLHAKKTGITPEIDERTQSRFDAGHAAEAAFRPHAEAIIGQDLYPVTGSLEIDGLKLLASFDGLTADDMIGFEHKSYNKDLAQAIELDGELPPAYYWQLEQQLLISGASYILFATTNGTKDKCAMINYASFPGRREALLAGWAQFAIDLEAYVPQEYIPAPVANPVRELPVLLVQAKGEITSTNMPEYKAQVTAYLATINKAPKTDQEFADSKEIAKRLREGAKKLVVRKEDMLAQTVTIGEVANEIDLLVATLNRDALELEKAVEREELTRKTTLIEGGKQLLAAHIESLNARLGMPGLISVPSDFAGAIKGLRKLESMQDAIDTELARAKIEANRRADAIDVNVKLLASEAAGCMSLFPDVNQLVLLDSELFALKVNARINDHKAKEEKRLEAERERIRAEEAKKLADAAAAAEKQRLADEEAAPVVASVSPPPKQEAPATFTSVIPPTLTAPPMLSASGKAFIASRQWPNESIRNSARAIVIEYERFCAQQMKVAA